MTNAMDFIDPANRLAVLEQVTAEGMLSLRKKLLGVTSTMFLLKLLTTSENFLKLVCCMVIGNISFMRKTESLIQKLMQEPIN